MTNRNKVFVPWGALFALGCTSAAPGAASTRPVPAQAQAAMAAAPVAPDSISAERNRLAKDVLAGIVGRENEPAGQVFKNVKGLNAVPASRLVAIMNFGYGRSLGVSCSHCHLVGQWESDAKPQKQIAREMSQMVSTINGQLLPNIKNLKSQEPIVNCTTCHRGSIKPALNLPQ